MKNLFENEENKKQLLSELNSWIGTPYQHWGTDKGIAADCSLFLLKIFNTLQIIKPITYFYYPRYWKKYGTEEILLKVINQIKDGFINPLYDLQRIDANSDLIFGDLLIFSLTSQYSDHTALYISDNKIIESTQKFGVNYSDYNLRKNLLTSIYRFLIKE